VNELAQEAQAAVPAAGRRGRQTLTCPWSLLGGSRTGPVEENRATATGSWPSRKFVPDKEVARPKARSQSGANWELAFGHELARNFLGASKHDAVFGPGVVVRITKPLLESVKEIIKTQDPSYVLKSDESVLKSADANASHAEVQAIVSYLQRHPQAQG